MDSVIDLSKLSIVVKSLNASLEAVGTGLAIATAVVVLGLLIEYAEDVREVFAAATKDIREKTWFRNLKALDGKVKRAVLGGIFITGGVGAELLYEHKASTLEGELQSANGQIVAFLNGKASDAEHATQGLKTEADKARAQAEGFKAQIADADARAKTAEAQVASTMAASEAASTKAEGFRLDIAKANESAAQARLELARITTPRTLSPVQRNRIIAALKPFAGTEFLMEVNPIPEAINLTDVISTTLVASGWKWNKIEKFGVSTISVGAGTAVIWYRGGLAVLFRPIAGGPPTFPFPAAETLASALKAENLGDVPIQLIPEDKNLEYISTGVVVVLVGSK
jgi:hypothetical protein